MLINRLGRWTFWFFAILLVILSVRNVMLGVEIGNPEMVYHLEERKAVLYVHIVASSLAMLLIPFQFWNDLRFKHRRFHRTLGRVCATAIVFGGVTGAIVGLGAEERYGTIGAAGFVVGSALWVAAALVAVHFARVRNFAAHRTWMIVTAALIFGAVSIRFEISIFRHAFSLTYDQATAVAAWSCWLLNVAVVAWWHRAALLAGRVRFA